MKQVRHTAVVWPVLVSLCMLAGCGNGGRGLLKPRSPEEKAAARRIDLTMKVVDGTVGQMAYLEGGGARLIRGYGLVVGLAGNGSSECPTEVRKKLVEEMGRMGIGQTRTGTAALTPNMLIDDPDTAVVVVSALVPPGTPSGVPLDASVSALPNSQTLSLDGGTLYSTELRAFSTATGAVRESRILADAGGPVFVNPFADNRDATATSRLRRGRVIGGCKTRLSRQIRLVLRQPDHARARALQQAINSRFGLYPRTANAKDPTYLMIRIPNRYRDDYEHFLAVLTHLYIRKGGGIIDLKARELVDYIALPDAPRESISLIWEGMGKQILPIIKPVFLSDNAEAAYYAARAGARIGDSDAVDVLAHVAMSDSPYRLEAIMELGRAGSVSAAQTLGELLSDSDDTIRVTAYEAIAIGRLGCGIKRSDVNGQFILDVVPSNEEHLVYVTRSGRPRIALFGEGIALRRPVFFNTPDDLVTINAASRSDQLQVFRRVGARKQLSEVISTPPDLAGVILALGGPPEKDPTGKIMGLGLSYSQVVGVVYRLCEGQAGKKVPAVIVLQSPDATDRIHPGRMPPGRLDMSRR